MIPVEAAIYRVRRDLTLGMVVKTLLVAAVFACMVFAPPSVKFAAIAGVIGLWLALGITSAQFSPGPGLPFAHCPRPI